ncbi:MAG: hypothetical protein K2J74_02405 [Muribaculaceae bacterium]|nr:hypothetical protein [Muribaculaceae bacterium]
MDQLEIMREQLAAMKQQLDTQQIINQDLLRKIMRGKASWLNRFVNIEIISIPFVYLLFVLISAGYGISQWYAASFLILASIDSAFDWRFVRISPRMFSTVSILELKKFLLKQKRGRFIQTSISAPLAAIWVVAFFAAIASTTNISVSSDFVDAAKTGGLIGGLIGAIVGLIAVIALYRKMQSTNDDLLRDIRDMENEK